MNAQLNQPDWLSAATAIGCETKFTLGEAGVRFPEPLFSGFENYRLEAVHWMEDSALMIAKFYQGKDGIIVRSNDLVPMTPNIRRPSIFLQWSIIDGGVTVVPEFFAPHGEKLPAMARYYDSWGGDFRFYIGDKFAMVSVDKDEQPRRKVEQARELCLVKVKRAAEFAAAVSEDAFPWAHIRELKNTLDLFRGGVFQTKREFGGGA